ncbi:MAG TPA: EscU/YscU/HrcU family type III secretion system export apparatus switch protein, partial [Candidatus Eremiobacteraceae bacterium]|nr:EscU/YscU/HrcU family type III secretion system export apparatus switch protein [Candidatus Eremiobacteraceae bacterium]
MSDGRERSEPATPRRRERARREGDHPTSAIAPCALAIVFSALPIAFGDVFASSWREAFAVLAGLAGDAGAGRFQAARMVAAATTWSLPIVVWIAWLAALAAAIGAAAASGALGWSAAALRFRYRGLSAGLRSLMSGETSTQSIISATAAAAVIVAAIPAVTDLLDRESDSWISTASTIGHDLFGLWWRASAALCAIAVVDVALARRRFAARLRMTPREVRDERAEQEGKPEVKARRRGIAIRRARRIRLEAIRRASAVIANPTHVAVALCYAPPATDVPIVVAAGAGA